MLGKGVLRTDPPTTPQFSVFSQDWSYKQPWFRLKPGTLTVHGKRLDGPGTFRADIPAPGAYLDVGFMPTQLTFSTGGCWQVTGRLRNAKVAFYVHIDDSPAAICRQLAGDLLTISSNNNPANATLQQVTELAYGARDCH